MGFKEYLKKKKKKTGKLSKAQYRWDLWFMGS